jgi:glycopeptide antibiotics resistance protein
LGLTFGLCRSPAPDLVWLSDREAHELEYMTLPSSTISWSNRILIAAVIGILFLTLFPFRFVLATKLPLNASPFLLGHDPKVVGPLDFFLNILLFIPFGFGLAEKLRDRAASRKTTFFVTLLTGALFSYTIEFLQIYIPSRDSGWEDIFTNSIGTGIGCVLFDRWGHRTVCFLSRCESALTWWLTFRRAVAIIPIYFAAWFAVSIPLQKKSLPSNWDPRCFLVVGNNAQAQYPWRGKVFRAQFWDRALPEELAGEITSGAEVAGAQDGMVGDLEFLGPSPLQDRRGLLPDLVWTPSVPDDKDLSPLVLDGRNWLISNAPVSDFVRDVQRTHQFAVRVVCMLGGVGEGDKRIVSISDSSGVTDLTLRQEDTNLVFWFRNPLSVRRSLLAWYVPKVFDAVARHDILFSYDGANLSLFIDGKKEPRGYQLGPGTALAQLFVRVIPAELDGYHYIYNALVFLPAGILMGFTTRTVRLKALAGSVLLGIGVCLPPVLLESMLISLTGRALSRANISLSVLLSIAGILWINADRRAA